MRRPNGTLLPGQGALNPSGRPYGLAKAVRKAANLEEMILTVCKMSRGEPVIIPGLGHSLIPSLRDVQWAIDWLANRGWGLPTQNVVIKEESQEDAFDPSGLSRTERDELKRLLARAAGEKPEETIEAEIVSETEIDARALTDGR